MSSTKQLSKNPDALSMLTDLVAQGLTDNKIQDRLSQEFNIKWSLSAIRRNRKRLGYNKNNQKSVYTPIKNKDNKPQVFSAPPPGLDDDEKAEWFRDQFKKTHLFVMLSKQFTKEEIDIYLEEYGRVCCQFEDIVTTEFFQIDEFLKHRILINRQLNLMKSTQIEIDKLHKWLTMHPPSTDDSDNLRQERIDVYQRLDDLKSSLNKSNDRYDKLVYARQKIEDKLAATRRDRLEELKGSSESFLGLVTKLHQIEKERNAHGKYAELTKIAAQDQHKEMRKKTKFPDGQESYVFLDHKCFDDK